MRIIRSYYYNSQSSARNINYELRTTGQEPLKEKEKEKKTSRQVESSPRSDRLQKFGT